MSWLPLTIFIFFNYFLPALVFLFIPYFFISGSRKFALHLLISLFLAWGIGFLIKSIFYFPRPYIMTGFEPLFSHPLDGSFPSGHTASTFVVAFGVFRRSHRLGFNLLVISAIVAATRVAYSFHSWQDVVGGIILAGIIETLAYHYIRY